MGGLPTLPPSKLSRVVLVLDLRELEVFCACVCVYVCVCTRASVLLSPQVLLSLFTPLVLPAGLPQGLSLLTASLSLSEFCSPAQRKQTPLMARLSQSFPGVW